jgi:hypothetical protein
VSNFTEANLQHLISVAQVVGEGRTVILHCHFLSFVGIPYTKKKEKERGEAE